MAALNLVVISGLSGSGKSHALKAFEDAGYFCVDNLPPALLPTFVELCHQQGGEIKNVALGIDIRERVFFGDLAKVLGELKAQGHALQLVFFWRRGKKCWFADFQKVAVLIPCCPISRW